MHPAEISELLSDSIYRTIESKVGISRDSISGSVANQIEKMASLTAESLIKQHGQLSLDQFSGDGDSPVEVDLNSVHPDNRLNDLTGSQWLYFTISILKTSYPSILGHELRRAQGGNKPPQLMQELIGFFTKSNELVLDPFAGAGGTALGAHLAGRRSVNIELNPDSIAIYEQVCKSERIQPHEFIRGDCLEILSTLEDGRFDFIATDPPYSPELVRTMSGDEESKRYGRRNRMSGYVSYSDDPRDLSKSGSFDIYFDRLVEVGTQLLRVLKQGRYLAMILRDSYQNGKYIPTSAVIGQRLSEVGWQWKGERIWYATGTRIRPYGYPNAYVPNIIHQSILILRKG